MLFDIFFTTEKMSFITSRGIFLACGMVPVFRSFYSKKYVELQLKKYYKNLLGHLYLGNLLWMIIGMSAQLIHEGGWGELNDMFLAKQSVFLLFWFLSIPLVLTYDTLLWEIWVIIILFITIGYRQLLDWYISNWVVNPYLFLFLTIGIVLISAAVSIKISHYRIRVLFGKNDISESSRKNSSG